MKEVKSLSEIYRLALIEGLTSAEASAKYGCLRVSLLNSRLRYGFPKLKSEIIRNKELEMEKLTDKEIKLYYEVLVTSCSDECKIEKSIVLKEIERRYISLE